MRDLDLAGISPQGVQLTTSGGDVETATLTENPANSGVFLGSLPVTPGVPTGGNGVLESADGETIVATYEDADDGTGSPATVADSAAVDCVVPVIANVQVQSVAGTQAVITFDTDEPATGFLEAGMTCGVVTHGAGGPSGVTSHSIQLGGLSPLTTYSVSITATDGAGNSATDDNGAACYSLTTLDQPDYFTELFDLSDGDLDHRTMEFTPDGSGDYYSACSDTTSTFPTDPAGGTTLSLADDASVEVPLTGGQEVQLYGVSYASCFVGSNGYVTFGSGDSDLSETLSDHFDLPRISALFDDLNPAAGGTISYRQRTDRLVVTYENVPEYSTGNSNNIQIEMFFAGMISITQLQVDAVDGLVGVSGGTDVLGDYVESDLSAYGICVCVDPDTDGICDPIDNCPLVSNADQANADGDDLGDACDPCPALVTPGDIALMTGDATADSLITSEDIIFMVVYTFKGGPPPMPIEEVGDVNCDGSNTSADILYLVNHVFKGGPPPCDVCAL